MRQQSGLHQFGHHGRHAAGMVIILAEIFARRLQVDDERHVVADRLPVVIVERHAEMAGDGVEMDRRVGRAADRRIDDDGVLEGLPRHDVGRLQILMHHFDDALAGLVGDLAALAVGRRNGGRTRQLHAERLGQRVHRGGGAHGVAIAGRRRRGGDDVHELVIVDLAGRQALARFPDDGAGAGALALVPAIEHRADRQRDGRNVDGGRRHQQRRRGLVAADGEHDAVERIAVEHLDQAEIGKVAVECGGRALAGLLDRMAREFEGDAAHRDDAFAHALGQFDMVAVAGRQVGAGLGDADQRLARHQLGARQAVIQVALEIERRHARIVGIVEPLLRAKFLLSGGGACHRGLRICRTNRYGNARKQARGTRDREPALWCDRHTASLR